LGTADLDVGGILLFNIRGQLNVTDSVQLRQKMKNHVFLLENRSSQNRYFTDITLEVVRRTS